MTKRELAWELMGDGCWIDANPNRWGICNNYWELGRRLTLGSSWLVVGPDYLTEYFDTHAEATDFVRSEIAKG